MTEKLNILMISHHRRYRITTRQHPIAKYLVERGHRVTILVTADRDRRGIKTSEWDGFRVVEAPDLLWGRLRSGWDPWSVLWRTIYLSQDNEPYDLVHCYETRPATIYPALAFCRRSQLPFLTDWIDWIGRGGLVTVNRPVWYRYLFGWAETYYEEAFRARADGLTVISTALADRAIGLGVLAEDILLLPGGTYPDLFKMRSTDECRARVGLNGDGPIIGFSSSDSHLDLDVVMAALAIVAQRFPNIKLLMTGQTGPAVMDLAAKYQVNGRLILTGFLPYEELPWYLGCADLFVLPFPDTIYNRGRWPNKINDYLSLGRPTVANACGDVTHLFEKHDVGLLAEWDAGDFAQKIITLLEKPGLAYHFGKEARKASIHDYCWPVMIERLEDFYYQTLIKKSREVN